MMPSLPSASLPPPPCPRPALARVRQWQSRELLLRQGRLRLRVKFPGGFGHCRLFQGRGGGNDFRCFLGHGGFRSHWRRGWSGIGLSCWRAGGPLAHQVAGSGFGAGRVGQAVRARLREVVVGPLNRLEWALRVELEGRLSGSRGGWRRWRRGVHLTHFTAGIMKSNRDGRFGGELFTTPTLWHPK